MACMVHKKLLERWTQIIQSDGEGSSALDAFWEIEDHRSACEVCKDEQLANILNLEPVRNVKFVFTYSGN